jgi:hypothetical protein
MDPMKLIDLLSRVKWDEAPWLGDGVAGRRGEVDEVEVFLLEDALDSGERVITLEVTAGPLEGFYQMKQVD